MTGHRAGSSQRLAQRRRGLDVSSHSPRIFRSGSRKAYIDSYPGPHDDEAARRPRPTGADRYHRVGDAGDACRALSARPVPAGW